MGPAPRIPLLALAIVAVLAVPASAADAAARCKLRDIPEPYAVREPVHGTLTAALEVLRRPQTPEDRGGLGYRFAGDFHKVSPPTMRRVAEFRGTGFWVMGATVGLDRMHARCRRLLPPRARRREARWYRRQRARPLRLAFLYGFPDAPSHSGAGFLGTAADLYAGRMYNVMQVGEHADDLANVAVGLAPDGVASVAATFAARTSELPVQGNAWLVELPPGEDLPLERLEWRDAGGRVVKAFDRP